MTWKPIGPEQMDGRVIAAGWELFPSKLAFVKRTPSGWFDVNEGRHTSIPTHYLPGVRPLGEAEEPQNEKTARVRVAVGAWKNGWTAEGRSNLPDCEARESVLMEGRRQGFFGPSEYRVITADIPIPRVREIAGSVEAVDE